MISCRETSCFAIRRKEKTKTGQLCSIIFDWIVIFYSTTQSVDMETEYMTQTTCCGFELWVLSRYIKRKN